MARTAQELPDGLEREWTTTNATTRELSQRYSLPESTIRARLGKIPRGTNEVAAIPAQSEIPAQELQKTQESCARITTDFRTKEEKIEAVLAILSAGVPGVIRACREANVPRMTFIDWVDADKDLAGRYARARSIGMDALAEEIVDLSDTEPSEVTTAFGSHADSAHVAWKKNQIDARKWLLSKLAPKKYGERIEQAVTVDLLSQVLDPVTSRFPVSG